jgi:hypothetical protein
MGIGVERQRAPRVRHSQPRRFETGSFQSTCIGKALPDCDTKLYHMHRGTCSVISWGVHLVGNWGYVISSTLSRLLPRHQRRLPWCTVALSSRCRVYRRFTFQLGYSEWPLNGCCNALGLHFLETSPMTDGLAIGCNAHQGLLRSEHFHRQTYC